MQGAYLRKYLNKRSEETMKETRKEEGSISESVFEVTYVNNGGLIQGMENTKICKSRVGGGGGKQRRGYMAKY